MQAAAPTGAIVYRARNLVNGHSYIGFTTQGLAVRERQHRKAAYDTQRKFRFHHALREHGGENFVFEMLGDFEGDVEMAKLYESEAIAKYRPEYNVLAGGGGGPMPLEVRQRMSASRTGRKFSPELRRKLSKAAMDRVSPGKGRKRDPDVIQRTIETKRRLIEAGVVQTRGGRLKGAPLCKPVFCVTDGKRHESIRAAAAFYDVDMGALRDVLNGRREHVRGLAFKFCVASE